MRHLVGNVLYLVGGGMLVVGLVYAWLARVNFSPDGEEWFGASLGGRSVWGVVFLRDRTLYTDVGWRYLNTSTILLVGGLCLLVGGTLLAW